MALKLVALKEIPQKAYNTGWSLNNTGGFMLT